jgi:hypothetical protein
VKKIWATLAILFGLGVIATTVWLIINGIKHPTARLSISIAILSAIGVPIALAVISVGYRQFRGPNSEALKTEAEAKRSAAAALEDAETAKTIKDELNAYVAIRSWRLEIERRRQELANATEALLQMLHELNAMEKKLSVEITEISPVTMQTLDAVLDAGPPITFPDIRIYGIPVGKGANILASVIYDYSEQRRLRRMASLAPGALQIAMPGRADECEAIGEALPPDP